MKKNTLIFISFSLIALLSFFFVFKNYLKSNVSNKLIETEIKSIVSLFLKNETEANKLYVGKEIKLEGTVAKKTFLNNEKTLFLVTPYSNVFIICEMDDKQKGLNKILPKQKIIIKGICKGFLQDVILLNCNILANE